MALTIAGAALYVLVRLGQQLFYEEFGLAPEDVGLGYAEALARAAGFAAYIALFIGIAVFVRARFARFRGIPRSRVAVLGAALGVVVIVSVVVGALQNANRVKRGDSVQSFFLTDYGLRGEPAAIAWLEGAPEGLAGLEDHELMLLDNSGGTVTLYDVTEQQTVQVPSSTVAVSLAP